MASIKMSCVCIGLLKMIALQMYLQETCSAVTVTIIPRLVNSAEGSFVNFTCVASSVVSSWWLSVTPEGTNSPTYTAGAKNTTSSLFTIRATNNATVICLVPLPGSYPDASASLRIQGNRIHMCTNYST